MRDQEEFLTKKLDKVIFEAKMVRQRLTILS
jgi:hypothetical protein